MKQLPYAHQMPYFRTSKSSADVWIEKVKDELKRAKATEIRSMYLDEEGRAAYLVSFVLEGDTYRQAWPVLKLRNNEELISAKVQAATGMYHALKAKLIECRIRGPRSVFGGDLVITPNGPTVGEVINEDLMRQLPRLMLPAPRDER